MLYATETNDILEAARALVPAVAARAGEVSDAGRVPPDLLAGLSDAGCFRMLVPRSHHGAELALPAQLRVIEELAAADGSVGWSVALGGLGPVLLALLPRPTLDALYASGPDVIVASAFNPTGQATPERNGYRVTGRWAFVSGCEYADWFVAHCLVDDGRQPPVRMMLLPMDEAEVVPTWAVSGLRGTGSHDVAVADVFVPDDRSFVLGGPPCLEGPLHRVPELVFSTLEFAGIAVGIARGALDDLLALARGKVPAFTGSTLAANPLFRNQFGEADARLRAARALLYTDADAAWAVAASGEPFTERHRAQARATATWVVRAAADVVDAAYTAAGGTANYLASPFQRRLRDIHALTQHFAVKADTYTLAGAVLAGQEVDLTFL